MYRILNFGADVHNDSYSLCAVLKGNNGPDQIISEVRVTADYRKILKFIDSVKKQFRPEDELDIAVGYEAGGLGFSLYHDLTAAGVNCKVIAPTTLPTQKGKKQTKTDRIDAQVIARAMTTNSCSYVHVPDEEDEGVMEYIRMRDDHKIALKKVKQQIIAECERHGYIYSGGKWTHAFMDWLSKLEFTGMSRETMSVYLSTYYYLSDLVERCDKRLEEIAERPKYKTQVHNLCCFKGIKTYTALAITVEIGDFSRFEKAVKFIGYLGLDPWQKSSGKDQNYLGITKAGNRHLRQAFVESAQAACQGKLGYKSKALKARQNGQPPEVIAYADKANSRILRKFNRLMKRGKNRNVAIVAAARELAGFIWGMATDHIALATK